jgi:hypothetical protein
MGRDLYESWIDWSDDLQLKERDEAALRVRRPGIGNTDEQIAYIVGNQSSPISQVDFHRCTTAWIRMRSFFCMRRRRFNSKRCATQPRGFTSRLSGRRLFASGYNSGRARFARIGR